MRSPQRWEATSLTGHGVRLCRGVRLLGFPRFAQPPGDVILSLYALLSFELGCVGMSRDEIWGALG